eukprot:10727704-Karenia_brevis.AAC.1
MDYDCWLQWAYRKDFLWFLIMIMGLRARKVRHPERFAWDFMHKNWLSFDTLTDKSICIMSQTARGISNPAAGRQQLRQAMGVDRGISKVVEHDNMFRERLFLFTSDDIYELK